MSPVSDRNYTPSKGLLSGSGSPAPATTSQASFQIPFPHSCLCSKDSSTQDHYTMSQKTTHQLLCLAFRQIDTLTVLLLQGLCKKRVRREDTVLSILSQKRTGGREWEAFSKPHPSSTSTCTQSLLPHAQRHGSSTLHALTHHVCIPLHPAWCLQLLCKYK